jgi:thiosulfate reductase cytochrome b subunit
VRQTARTLHFLAAFGLVLFVFVHVLMVILSGPWNNLRSMVSGRYDIESSSNIREQSHAS